jgi:hypothetical protein
MPESLIDRYDVYAGIFVSEVMVSYGIQVAPRLTFKYRSTFP